MSTPETVHVYPKARAPLAWAVLRAANERAERWRLRCVQARVLEAQVIAACDAVGIPHDVSGLIRHHRGNAALAAAMDAMRTPPG